VTAVTKGGLPFFLLPLPLLLFPNPILLPPPLDISIFIDLFLRLLCPFLVLMLINLQMTGLEMLSIPLPTNRCTTLLDFTPRYLNRFGNTKNTDLNLSKQKLEEMTKLRCLNNEKSRKVPPPSFQRYRS